MPSTLSDSKKPKIGRPTTGIGKAIGLRLYPDLEAKIDAWCAQQPDKLSRPEAIRRLLVEALERHARRQRRRSDL
jgi:hypothetical protein